MSELWVQRKFPRYPIQIPLVCKPKGTPPDRVGAGWTRDLSAGGACLELGERLRPQVFVQVRLRTAHGPIEVEAQVIWAGEPISPTGGIPHGVAFRQLLPDQLQALLTPFSTGTHTRVRLPVDFTVSCKPKRSPRAALQGRAGDMSRGGMSLLFPEAMPPGTEVEITLPTATGPIRVTGEIVWVDTSGSAEPLYPPSVHNIFGETVWLDLPERRTPEEPPVRHGVQFTALDWSVARHLGLLLAQSE